MGHCVVVLGLISDHGGGTLDYSAKDVLPLHIQSTSIRYSPLAFRFIARQVWAERLVKKHRENAGFRLCWGILFLIKIMRKHINKIGVFVYVDVL